MYDTVYSAKSEPSELDPILDVLAQLAYGGSALEFAVGTGLVALPLGRRVHVHGIELSPHMIEQFEAKPGADAVPVALGDMTTTRVPSRFTLVYLVANTIMNVTTQDDQLAVFANAAAASCSRSSSPNYVASRAPRTAGFSHSIPTTWASRRSTIR